MTDPPGPPGAHPGYHHHHNAMHYVIEMQDRYGHWSDDPAMLGGGFSEGTNHWPSYRMAASARTQMILIGMNPDRIRIVSRD